MISICDALTAGTPVDTSRTSPHVMLVSHSHLAHETAAQVLRATECPCCHVESLSAARQTRNSEFPDLLLLDGDTSWTAPNEVGPLLQTFAKHRVPTVLLASDRTPTELVENAFEAGLDDCIWLPLTTAHLRSRMATLRSPSDRSVQRAHLWAEASSSWLESIEEQLELNGIEVQIHLGGNDERPAEPGDVTVAAWQNAARWSRMAPADPREIRVVVSSSPRPEQAGGIHAWIDRSVPTSEIVATILRCLNISCRDLRAHERIPFFCPVEFREWGKPDERTWSTGFAFGLSPGGLFIKTLVPLRRKIAVEMRVHLTTTNEQLPVTGVVAWSNPWSRSHRGRSTVGMGVEFLGMPLSKRLLHLIRACRAA